MQASHRDPAGAASFPHFQSEKRDFLLNLTPILALVTLIRADALIQAKHSWGFRKLFFGAAFVASASRLHAD